MSKVAIVYWSGTGNTAKMADAVEEGVKSAGAEAVVVNPADFTADSVAEYHGIAFGCAAMGAEQLEETEYQPMWDDVRGALSGKKVGLFGSYGWGDGEWMRTWEERVNNAGASLVTESVICNDAPDDEAIEACKALGAAFSD